MQAFSFQTAFIFLTCRILMVGISIHLNCIYQTNLFKKSEDTKRVIRICNQRTDNTMAKRKRTKHVLPSVDQFFRYIMARTNYCDGMLTVSLCINMLDWILQCQFIKTKTVCRLPLNTLSLQLTSFSSYSLMLWLDTEAISLDFMYIIRDGCWTLFFLSPVLNLHQCRLSGFVYTCWK